MFEARPVLTNEELAEASAGGDVICGLGQALLTPVAAFTPDAPATIPDMAEAIALAPAGTALSPVAGFCLDPLLRAGDVAILHGAALRPGDVAVFIAKGDPLGMRGKCYLGLLGPSDISRALYGDHPGPFAIFQQWEPMAFVLVPLSEIAGVLSLWGRIRDGAVAEFDDPPGLPWMREDIAAIADPTPLDCF